MVISLLRRRDFLVLVVVSFLIAIVHQFVVAWYSPFMRTILDRGGWGAVGTDDQFRGADLRNRCAGRAGSADQAVGIQTHDAAGRMRLPAAQPAVRAGVRCSTCRLPAVVPGGTGQALHGFCFGCFMAVGYMYVDKIAPPDVRGSMQTLYGVFVLSLGFFVGRLVSGGVADLFTDGDRCGGRPQLDRHLAQLCRPSAWSACCCLRCSSPRPSPRAQCVPVREPEQGEMSDRDSARWAMAGAGGSGPAVGPPAGRHSARGWCSPSPARAGLVAATLATSPGHFPVVVRLGRDVPRPDEDRLAGCVGGRPGAC